MLVTDLIKALRHTDASHATRSVLLDLVGYADNKTGECWPTQATLAKNTGASHTTVEKAINWAIDVGWLTKIERARSGKTVIYTYTFTAPFTIPTAPLTGVENEVVSAPLSIPATPLTGAATPLTGSRQRHSLATELLTTTTHANDSFNYPAESEGFAHVVKEEENTEEESVTPLPTPRRSFKSLRLEKMATA